MKRIILGVLLGATSVLGGVAWAQDTTSGPEYTNDGPRWNCLAEDEVVVIDHTCRHIDTLVTPRFTG